MVPVGTFSFRKKGLTAKCHTSSVFPEVLVGTGPRNCEGMGMTSHLGTEPSTEAGLLKQAGPECIPRPPSSLGAEATALPPPVCSVRQALALHGGPNLVTSWRIQAAAKAVFWVQHHVGLPSAFSKGERIKFSLDGKLAPLGLVTPLLG